MTRPTRRSRGFTLTELLVVILIITLITAATLPAVLPALNSRRVSEGSRIIQSELARARDAAVRGNSPHGFRLIPDPIDPSRPNALTSSRLVALEPASDYDDGMVQRLNPNGVMLDSMGNIVNNPPVDLLGNPIPVDPAYASIVGAMQAQGYLPSGATNPFIVDAMKQLAIVHEVKTTTTILGVPPTQFPVVIPSTPTSWYWNIRQGDKIQLAETGRYYTIAGPMLVPNPERYINFGPPTPGATPPNYPTGAGSNNYEFLILVDSKDDNDPFSQSGNGFVDEGFDGIDNDGDNVIDPGFNGIDDDGNGVIDDFLELFFHQGFGSPPPGVNFTGPLFFTGPYLNEFEHEAFTVTPHSNPPQFLNGNPLPTRPYIQSYTISRRPVPSEGAREVALPTNVVVDLTTWSATQPERSRLPVDINTKFVDVMVAPNGQILVAGPGTNVAPPVAYPFYHFWFCERDEVNEPTLLNLSSNKLWFLPMPQGSGNDPRITSTLGDPTQNVPTLKGERRLLSVNTRSGAITATAIETMYLNNTSYPFEAAEAGIKDTQP